MGTLHATVEALFGLYVTECQPFTPLDGGAPTRGGNYLKEEEEECVVCPIGGAPSVFVQQSHGSTACCVFPVASCGGILVHH